MLRQHGTRIHRESARESRRRKKEYVSVLEDKISALEAEALQLKLSLNMGKEAMEREEKEKRELTAEMQTLLDSNATEDHFRSVREVSTLLPSVASQF